MQFSSSLEDALGRPLYPFEMELLEHVSAQGVAKINFDICRGADMAQSLLEMRGVFEDAQQRRRLATVTGGGQWQPGGGGDGMATAGLLLADLSLAAQTIVNRVKRPLSTDERRLVEDIPATVLFGKLNPLLLMGETLEDALEELAIEHRQKQLMCEAQQLANAHGVPVAISRLAPTFNVLTSPVVAAPPSPGTSAISQAVSVRPDKIRLGLSPVVTWFDEFPKSPNSDPSPFTDAFSLSTPTTTQNSSTPRSVLKPQRGSPNRSTNSGGCSGESPGRVDPTNEENKRMVTWGSFESSEPSASDLVTVVCNEDPRSALSLPTSTPPCNEPIRNSPVKPPGPFPIMGGKPTTRGNSIASTSSVGGSESLGPSSPSSASTSPPSTGVLPRLSKIKSRIFEILALRKPATVTESPPPNTAAISTARKASFTALP